MEKDKLQNILLTWPKRYIRDTELVTVLQGSSDSRYGLIKRAMDAKWLIRLKRGFYIIGEPYQRTQLGLFEIAQLLYGPSYISLESALSYYQWIPEAVYTITSATNKRATEFSTPLSQFSFAHVPLKHFYLGVERTELKNETFYISTPWRALADYLYIYKKTWTTCNDLIMDLRIEVETLLKSNKSILKEVSKNYPSMRVKKQLKNLWQELK